MKNLLLLGLNDDDEIGLNDDDENLTTKEAFLNALSELPNPKVNKHELQIVTCYINFNTLYLLIKSSIKKIKLTDVYLMFNIGEVYRIGQNKTISSLKRIENFCSSNSINFQWQTVSGSKGNPVHAKGYAIFQKAKKKYWVFVLVTSSNLTRRGFDIAGNIELGYLTREKHDFEEFQKIHNYLWKNNAVDIKDVSENNKLFPYALLSSGIFLYKWNLNIRNLTGIKYDFTDNAKNQLRGNPKDPILKSLNTRLDTDSHTAQYLDFSNLPQKSFPKDFTKKYTVECYLGYWCPMTVWKIVEKNLEKDLEEFINQFKEATSEDNILEAKEQAERDLTALYGRGLIKKKTNLDKWIQKIKNLRRDKERLRRLHNGYEDFKLPYDYIDKENIKELYESFENTLNSLKQPINERLFLIKMKAFEAIEKNSLESLNISSDEKSKLIEKFEQGY